VAAQRLLGFKRLCRFRGVAAAVLRQRAVLRFCGQGQSLRAAARGAGCAPDGASWCGAAGSGGGGERERERESGVLRLSEQARGPSSAATTRPAALCGGAHAGLRVCESVWEGRSGVSAGKPVLRRVAGQDAASCCFSDDGLPREVAPSHGVSAPWLVDCRQRGSMRAAVVRAPVVQCQRVKVTRSATTQARQLLPGARHSHAAACRADRQRAGRQLAMRDTKLKLGDILRVWPGVRPCPRRRRARRWTGAPAAGRPACPYAAPPSPVRQHATRQCPSEAAGCPTEPLSLHYFAHAST